MDKKIKKLWVDALISGEYTQGQHRLRTNIDGNTSFCCLGVLCNIHAQENPHLAIKQTDNRSYFGQMEFLPVEVTEWARIGDSQLYVIIDGENVHLAEHNDDGTSFEKIAKAIDEQM